ncbi:hypothetical protein M8J77_012460 [Diaphorina citri]|nr:hypothetical protein M8J77_012460 [Diaphorina citri]
MGTVFSFTVHTKYSSLHLLLIRTNTPTMATLSAKIFMCMFIVYVAVSQVECEPPAPAPTDATKRAESPAEEKLTPAEVEKQKKILDCVFENVQKKYQVNGVSKEQFDKNIRLSDEDSMKTLFESAGFKGNIGELFDYIDFSFEVCWAKPQTTNGSANAPSS